MLAPPLHVNFLYVELTGDVIVRLVISAKDNSLANAIERMRTAAKATIGSVKVILDSKSSNCGVVIGSIIKYKVT